MLLASTKLLRAGLRARASVPILSRSIAWRDGSAGGSTGGRRWAGSSRPCSGKSAAWGSHGLGLLAVTEIRLWMRGTFPRGSCLSCLSCLESFALPHVLHGTGFPALALEHGGGTMLVLQWVVSLMPLMPERIHAAVTSGSTQAEAGLMLGLLGPLLLGSLPS